MTRPQLEISKLSAAGLKVDLDYFWIKTSRISVDLYIFSVASQALKIGMDLVRNNVV